MSRNAVSDDREQPRNLFPFPQVKGIAPGSLNTFHNLVLDFHAHPMLDDSAPLSVVVLLCSALYLLQWLRTLKVSSTVFTDDNTEFDDKVVV